MLAVVATLAVGGIIGYLGQRSRFCIVSGVRDWFLIHDSYRIKGLFGLIVAAAISFVVFRSIGGDVPNLPMGVEFGSFGYVVISIIGGLGIGFFSVLAEGCPFRQHVMAAEGRQSALFYLLGFYIGIIYFYAITFNFIKTLLTIMG
ncbi:YeeE/YedE family protein [Candidatus Pacearchaeota archaeon]|nr:YeeE/YedE family protein [Candidatus Pacearchaeota archaeon]